MKTAGKTAVLEIGGARGGAVAGQFGPIGPDLAVVVEAWPTLSEAVRESILATVQAGSVPKGEGG